MYNNWKLLTKPAAWPLLFHKWPSPTMQYKEKTLMRKLVTQFKTILALINCSFEKFKFPPPSMGLKQISPPRGGRGGLIEDLRYAYKLGSSHLIKIHCTGVSSLTNLSSQIWLGMIPASLEPSVLLAWNETKTTHSTPVFVTFPNHRRICSKVATVTSCFAYESFRQRPVSKVADVFCRSSVLIETPGVNKVILDR